MSKEFKGKMGVRNPELGSKEKQVRFEKVHNEKVGPTIQYANNSKGKGRKKNLRQRI